MINFMNDLPEEVWQPTDDDMMACEINLDNIAECIDFKALNVNLDDFLNPQ